MTRRVFCILLSFLMLTLSACSSAFPSEDSSGGEPGASVHISDAVSDAFYTDSKCVAQCAVDSLREDITGAKWFSADVLGECTDPAQMQGERRLNLVLEQTSDLTSVSVRWYQGGADANDIRAEKGRTYLFYIEVSSDAKEWKCIYPSDFDLTRTYARSSTGAEYEEYPCEAKGVNYVRIVGAGCEDPQDSANNRYFAVRSVRLGGTMSGEGGGDPAKVSVPLYAHPYHAALTKELYSENKLTVYFVRHGKSDYTISTNQTASLNDLGKSQAQAISDYFSDRHISLDAVYTSPYQRCVETAAPLAEAHSLKAETVPQLFERTIATGIETIPTGFAEQQWQDYEYCLEGGESLAEVEARMIEGLHTIFDRSSENGDEVIAVSTHAMALSVLLNTYHAQNFRESQGQAYYSRILSLQTPCVKCVFEEDRLIYMQFIDIPL